MNEENEKKITPEDVFIYVSTGFWNKEQFLNWVSKLKTDNFAQGARLYKQLIDYNPKHWRD